jgi:outer membrane protein assembly factor BamB
MNISNAVESLALKSVSLETSRLRPRQTTQADVAGCAPLSALLALAIFTICGASSLFAQQESGLIAHWRFAPDRRLGNEVKAVFGKPDVTFSGSAKFVADPAPARVELDGRSAELLVATDLSKALLPPKDITAEAWVRMDKADTWGGIFGALQDNGEFERGWLLGNRDSALCFGLASEKTKRLNYLTSPKPFELGRWHHVVGTYDGAHLCLYVNGELAAKSGSESGPIAYAPNGPVTIGSYRDDNEDHRMTGAIHEVRLFRRALAPEEVRERYDRKKTEFPEPAPPPRLLRLSYGPFADWRDRTTTVVTWETDAAMPTRLELELSGGKKVSLGQEGARTRHEVVLSNLKPDLEHHYRILAPADGATPVQSKRYQFDTTFYWEPPTVPPAAAKVAAQDDRLAKVATELLAQSGARDGYCFVLGAVDGRLALELVRQSRLDVIVVESDPARVAAVRQTLDRAGVYGARASVHHAKGTELPFGDMMANLIVSESAFLTGKPPFVSCAEVARLQRPTGGTVILGTTNTARSDSAWKQWLAAAPLPVATLAIHPDGISASSVGVHGLWIHSTRPALPGAGEWSHQYGSADNSACSQDELVGGELQPAWWGDPGPRPMPDRGNRNPAPLSVNGRLFVQGNRVLFGLDAYNGAMLWSLSAPEVRRANVTRDCSNWAAAGDDVYLAHGRYCLVLDGRTGARLQRFEVVENTPGAYDWGYVSVTQDGLIGSRQKTGGAYLGDDGEWYEDYAPDQVSRVTSDRLFAHEPATGKLKWTYQRGAILNSTITIADGMVLFLESRNPEALATNTCRLPNEVLTDQVLVALDANTGRELWQKAHDFSACQFMTYLVYANSTAVVTGTDRNKNYHTFAFNAPPPGRKDAGDSIEDAIPGRLLWSDTHKEDKGHHSGHLQHPLIVGSTFFSDQRSFDLRAGTLLRTDLPERRGCGVMSAAKNAVFFRHHFHGMWDLKSDKRVQFEGIRSGCWLGLITSGGMLLAPESGAGCSCTHAIQTSVGYFPKSLVKR